MNGGGWWHALIEEHLAAWLPGSFSVPLVCCLSSLLIWTLPLAGRIRRLCRAASMALVQG